MTRAEFDELARLARAGHLSALARQLLGDITNAIDVGLDLPGRREWASRREVSLRTLERALAELSRAGIVTTTRSGRGPAHYVVEVVEEGRNDGGTNFPFRHEMAVDRHERGDLTGLDRHNLAVNRHERPDLGGLDRQNGGSSGGSSGGLKGQRAAGDIHTRGRAAMPAPAAAPPATPSPDGGDPPSVSGASAVDLHLGLSDQAFVVERMRRAGRRVNPDLYPRFARWFADGATREDVLYAFQEAAMHRPAAYVAYVEEVVGRCIAARLEAAAGVPAPVIVLDHYRRAGGGA